MIIGNGDIASVLVDDPGLTLFAAGVSNSQETRETEYGREYALMMQQPEEAHLVYFSTLSIFYYMNRYVAHKLRMEQLVKERFRRWTIVRIGNITWGDNPNTLINFFKGQMARGETPQIRDEYRYIVSLEEFQHWTGLIPRYFSCEMNITGERMKVHEVWKRYVGHRSDVESPLPLQDPLRYKQPKVSPWT